VSVSRLQGCRVAASLLERVFHTADGLRRISTVGGALRTLLRLTTYLDHDGRADLTTRIDWLQSTSGLLTTASRERLERFWGARVLDRFGLSETLPGAWRCEICDAYHFEPYGVAEVVGLHDRHSVQAGRGELLLTGFYPFHQMTPLIRYATGDVVELRPNRCPTGAPAYVLHGRRSRLVDLPDGATLSEAEILETLDGVAGIAHEQINRNLPDWLSDAGGAPRYAWRSGAGHVDIEVAPAPHADCQALIATMRRRLIGVRPDLRQALACGSLRLGVGYGDRARD
jgi:hypothetical protein